MSPREVAAWERRCEAFVRARLAGDPAHDLAHVRRVVASARHLAAEEGADPFVVLAAAWLHDVVPVPKDDPRRAQASRLAADVAAAFLLAGGLSEGEAGAVAHAVEAHSFSARVEPRTLEARVVQDADRLDALGAIGIARCFATAGALGRPLVAEDEPFPTGRPPDDARSAVDHFYTKLLGLPTTMRTSAGRAEGERRAAFMRAYLRQLAREVAGGEPHP